MAASGSAALDSSVRPMACEALPVATGEAVPLPSEDALTEELAQGLTEAVASSVALSPGRYLDSGPPTGLPGDWSAYG